MNMIGHATDLEENTTFSFDNSAHISMNLITNFRTNDKLTIFRTENNVIYQIG